MGNMRVTNDRGTSIGDAIARAKVLEQFADEAKSQLSMPPASNVSASRFVRGGLVAAFVVGTGGLMTADFVTARNDRGYRLQEFSFRGEEFKAASRQLIRSSIENLARVRSVFRPTTTELASLLGVSRQAIYNWQAGQPVAIHNDARLEELASSADLLIASGIAGIARPLARKLPGGRTVLDAIREGLAPGDAVRRLMSMLEREVRQRETLSQRLAGRTRKPVDTNEIGAPHLDESA